MNIHNFFYNTDTFKGITPTNLKQPIMSGHQYRKLCKWNLCPRYKIVFDPQKVENDDLVFINGDYIEPNVDTLNFTKFFRHYFTDIKPRAVIHNSDFHFTKEHYENIKPYFSQISKYFGVVSKSVELSSKNFFVLSIKLESYNNIESIKVCN